MIGSFILYDKSCQDFILDIDRKGYLICSYARIICLIAYRTKDKQLGPKSSIMTSFCLSQAPSGKFRPFPEFS